MIRMSHTLIKSFREKGVEPNFYIFTVDVNPHSVAIAQKMIQLAGLSSHVDFIVLQDAGKNELSEMVRLRMSRTPAVIDFLFIDHGKGFQFD